MGLPRNEGEQRMLGSDEHFNKFAWVPAGEIMNPQWTLACALPAAGVDPDMAAPGGPM